MSSESRKYQSKDNTVPSPDDPFTRLQAGMKGSAQDKDKDELGKSQLCCAYEKSFSDCSCDNFIDNALYLNHIYLINLKRNFQISQMAGIVIYNNYIYVFYIAHVIHFVFQKMILKKMTKSKPLIGIHQNQACLWDRVNINQRTTLYLPPTIRSRGCKLE